MQQYYLIGALFLGIFWIISGLITKNLNPFAMAKGSGIKGENRDFSASLLQMIVFTMLTVFAYTTVFAARFFEPGGALIPTAKDWLQIPSNLLILMGISVGTAVASRAIRSQNDTGLPASRVSDSSSLTTDVNGKTDLIKIQMLIWTVIAVVVYLAILSRFMMNSCYLMNQDAKLCGDVGNSLPDIDSAFMVLLGVSQGGYIVNKLSEGSKAVISIEPATLHLTAAAPSQTLTAKMTDAQGNPVTSGSFDWVSDNPAAATVDNNGLVTRVSTGECGITATANSGAVVSNKCAVKCD